jgi:hypothetical protein
MWVETQSMAAYSKVVESRDFKVEKLKVLLQI